MLLPVIFNREKQPDFLKTFTVLELCPFIMLHARGGIIPYLFYSSVYQTKDLFQ